MFSFVCRESKPMNAAYGEKKTPESKLEIFSLTNDAIHFTFKASEEKKKRPMHWDKEISCIFVVIVCFPIQFNPIIIIIMENQR